MELGEYKCSGKKYNGEKAIISLTSWKARINTVSKTLYSLLKMCPGFHIVLVLSEEEFPKMEKELPENLMLFVDNELIELLWIYPNIKSFKKVLPTMDKYKDVPIISADDDCIYTCNYAELLYNAWLKNDGCVITYKIHPKYKFQNGPSTLYFPNCFGMNGLRFLNKKILDTNQDDCYIGILLKELCIKTIGLSNSNKCYVFHDNKLGMSDNLNEKDVDEYIKKILMEVYGQRHNLTYLQF